MNKNFLVKIPFGWKEKLEDFLYNIYNPNGNGSIQISIHLATNKNIDLVETLRKSAKVKDILILKTENSVETKFLRESSFWKMKVVKNGKNVAFLSYNCYKDNIDPYEIRTVNKIFNSFKFMESKKRGMNEN